MATEQPYIEQLELSGYKSIRHAAVDFGRLNVLIGANGAGKSGLASYFSLLNASFGASFDEHIIRSGGANSLLHLGVGQTSEIESTVTVLTTYGRGKLKQRFVFRPPDGLSPLELQVEWSDKETFPAPHVVAPSADWRLDAYLKIYGVIFGQTRVYHFDDASFRSPARSSCYIEDAYRLRANGGNLAAMLHRYQHNHPTVYHRIRSAIRLVAPSFDDFVLKPQPANPANILLNWRQIGSSDYLFGPHQLSDGSLRAMALITLLLQPEADLPNLLIVDEPELGLHPFALSIVAGLIRAASTQTQVIVATQSAEFLDHFEPSEIIVADSVGGESQFRRLDVDGLQGWLEDYSIGELWQKNVIGGGPMS